jgi:hypothetical protein
LGLLACLALVGCGPSDPLDLRVSARTESDFTLWQADLSDRLSPALREEVQAMVEEVRLGLMVDGKASGTAAIDEALRTAIDGLTVRKLLADG